MNLRYIHKFQTNKRGVSMPIVRVTSSHQVTIPAEIRRIINVSSGDYVEIFVSKEGMVVMKPVEIVEKKTKSRKKRTKEDEAWERLAEEEMLKHYDKKDSIYDTITL